MTGRPPLASPSIPGLFGAGWKTALLALGAALPPLFTSVYLYRRLRTLRRAVLSVLSAPPDSRAWVTHRLAISDLLRQGNTYMTWSLALVVDRSRPTLYTPLASTPDVAPTELGVTASSTPTFLKALDLGGGDQRKITALLDAGDTQGAEKLLADNKKGDDNRCFILTGGPLARRQQNCQRLAAAFPSMVFVALHPEAEGRMTLRSGAAELMRLATASGGAITHVLLVAKGSTDLHIAWLRAEGGVALGDGCAASEVHRLEKTSPSSATEVCSRRHQFATTRVPAGAHITTHSRALARADTDRYSRASWRAPSTLSL